MAAKHAPSAPERLPGSARPTHYALSLTVVPGEETIRGEVTIELELSRPLDVIWLNGTQLDLRQAALTVGNLSVAAVARVASSDFIAVVPEAAVGPGKAVLTLGYSAVLSKGHPAGFFQLGDGEEHYAYTHFETSEARRAFPCFDEPSFKVPWTVTLHVKREHLALANAPQVSEVNEPGGMKAVTFARTPPLPSYLVAMAVGPFDVVDAGAWGKKKTRVRIVTPRGKSARASYAARATGPLLEELERSIGVSYPYEKLDQVSMPVIAGGMENPGLVTYGEQLVLEEPGAAALSRRRAYAQICAHELAHMWFGGMVTMQSWDDLWLKEAFAAWMGGKVVERWQPTWAGDVSRVLNRDASLSTDAPVSPSVISMWESYAGEETFRGSLQRYLEQHAFANVTPRDFLAALSQVAGRQVAAGFETFSSQPGAPVVSFELRCPEGTPPTLALSQSRYQQVGSKEGVKQVWSVPICVRFAIEGKIGRTCTLLTGESDTLQLGQATACPDWLLPNDGMFGHYRASLSGAADLKSLLERAGGSLSVAERVGVLSDLRALVLSGDVEIKDALGTVPAAVASENRHLVAAAIAMSSSMSGDMVPEALRPKYRRWVRSIFGPLAQRLSLWVDGRDDEDTRLMRPQVLGLVAIQGQEPRLRAQSLDLARRWLKDRSAVHSDVLDIVLAIAADTADASFHYALLAAAKGERDPQARLRMLGALGAFRDSRLVASQLAVLLSGEFDADDAMRLLWEAATDERSRPLAIDFVESHYDALMQLLPREARAELVWVVSSSCDEKSRNRARAFFEGRASKYPEISQSLAGTLDTIDSCIAYVARQQPSAVAFLEGWTAK